MPKLKQALQRENKILSSLFENIGFRTILELLDLITAKLSSIIISNNDK